MKKLLVLAVACLVTSPAFAADLKWYGDVGVRYNQNKFDDGMAATTSARADGAADVSKETTKAHMMHARLGVTGGKDHVDYGVGLHTSGATNNTDYVYFNNNNDRTIAAELAYLRYSNDFGFGDLSVTMGRGENVFAADHNGQILFDNDITWDGFGWKWKMGNIGFNASQYIIGGNNAGTVGNSTITNTEESNMGVSQNSAASAYNRKQNFTTMLGFQPTFNFRFTDEIEAMFAVGYYIWNGQSNTTTNTVHGHQASLNSNARRTSTGAISDDAQTVAVNNPHQWQFLVDTSLPMNFNASFEYIQNKKMYYDAFAASAANVTTGNYGGGMTREMKRSAWAGTLTYGKLARAHDWKVGYTYANRGLASAIDAYTNDSVLADEKGHILTASYNLTDSMSLGGRYISTKEISKMDAQGNSVGNATTSANATSRSHANKYWELTAGVAF